jgi:regulator of protease activity HflC (stomatin/prohibitin superfamily)
LILALVVAAINPIDVERIDAGHVGIKVSNIGDNRGVGKTEYVTGWVFYNSWISKIYEFPIHQQHIDYEEADIVTRGGFRATIKPSFNYSINPGNVASMFQNLRVGVKEMEQGWLKNAIVGSVNDVANRYTVDSIFNHREEFEGAIVKECNKRVSQWFNVSQLRTNIVPPKEISESIVAKTRAIQEVQVAENQRQVAVAEAERKIAEARGDSAQAVIQAAGRAEAIRKEQLSLTPLYIEYIKIQKWSGQVPTTVAGGNSGFLIQLDKNAARE